MDDNASSMEERMTTLESSLAHHQHEYETLNQVVIEQAAQIDKLHLQLAKFESIIRNLAQQMPEEPRDLSAERPPHY